MKILTLPLKRLVTWLDSPYPIRFRSKTKNLFHQNQNYYLYQIVSNNHSFAFSGCGWLTPFHLGVVHHMKNEGYITDKSVFGGTSGGSLAALIACLDIDTKDCLELLITLSKKKGMLFNVDKELRSTLTTLLPTNTLSKCNGRLHVTVTQVKSLLPCKVVSKFENKDQLIDIVTASCFIPIYSARRLTTDIIGYDGHYVDGGIRGFMPPIGDIRVTPFPIGFLKGILHRYPHITLPPKSYHIPQLLLWSLKPASPEQLVHLYEEGIVAADRYIKLNSDQKSNHSVKEI